MPPKKKGSSKDSAIVYQAKKERIDRVAESQTIFEELSANAKSVKTVVLLLNSPEEHIVLNAFHHLDKFAMQFVGNLTILYDHNILLPIFNHFESQHRFIRRFAMKILSQILDVPAALQELLQNEACFSTAMHTFNEIDDDFLVEYSAIVLNRLCSNERFRSILAGSPEFVKVLLPRIASTSDPDVLYQCLELTINITQCQSGLEAVCGAADFPFSFLLATMKNEFTEVQYRAVDVLINLSVCRQSHMISNMKDPLFFEETLSILENVLWPDMHDRVITLLKSAVKEATVADSFYNDIYFGRFMDFVNSTETHKSRAVAVLVELANYPDAREILHEYQLNVLLNELLAKCEMNNVALGLGLMANFKPALDDIVAAGTLELLFARLMDADVSVEIQKEICVALKTMFKLSSMACFNAVQCDGVSNITDLLARPVSETSVELKMQLVAMLVNLSRQRTLRTRIMSDDMAKSLYFTLRESKKCALFTVELLNCMAAYISEETLQFELLRMDFCQILIDCLSISEPMALKKTAIDFILACEKYTELTDKFIMKKVLDCLLTDSDALVNCPNWTEAIDLILANNLPMKFALCGYLEIKDITGDNFFATRKKWTHYRRLQEIFDSECSPKRPIIVCHFNNVRPSVSNLSVRSMQPSTETAVREPCDYNRRPYDPHLPKYLQTLTENLQIDRLPKELIKAADMKSCIATMANFVCRKLCCKLALIEEYQTNVESKSDEYSVKTEDYEPSVSDDDCENRVEQHMLDLKTTQFNCNIIPLGFIRMGGFFEKSLLFKVLADRVGLPCTLKMDENNNSLVWNEVAIPMYDPDEACGDIIVPSDQKPTHIVDLMDCPGNLYTIGCRRAYQYQQKTT